MEIEYNYTVYVGGEETMKDIANRGYIRVLNRKTMKWHNFGKEAKYKAIKDTHHNITNGWILLSNMDVRTGAIKQGYFMSSNTHGGKRPNSGRHAKEPTETINFRLPVSIKAKAKKVPELSKKFRLWIESLI